MTILHIDYETKSKCDLITCGTYKYANDESTGILLMGYAFGEGPVQMWHAWRGEPFPEDVKRYIKSGGLIYAHNAEFECEISWCCLPEDVPFIDDTQWYCTAAQARASGLPGKLEDLGRFLKLPVQKDKRGVELIKLLSMPQADGRFLRETDPARYATLMDEFAAYCRVDVETERLAAACSRPLSEDELAEYHAHMAINRRGLPVDVAFARVAVTFAEQEKAELGEKIRAITDGAVTTARQFQRIKAWVEPRVTAEQWALTERYVDGEKKHSLDATVRASMLADESLDEDVRLFLQWVDDAGATSVSKYQAMLDREVDQYVQGSYLFGGATQTGRFSATGIQVHNLRRDPLPDAGAVIDAAVTDGALPVPVMDTLARLLRPPVWADEGQVLVWGDWSGIEARALPYLSAHPAAVDVLDAFRLSDADPEQPDNYMMAAADIYHVDPAAVDEGQRQIGKVAVLSLGYGGGVGAFKAMARNYGVSLPDSVVEGIRDAWRRANPWATAFWQNLHNAAVGAVRLPGRVFEAGRVAYQYQPAALNGLGALYCRLPSGRVLCYPGVAVEMLENKWGTVDATLTYYKSAWKPGKNATDWPRATLWHGVLVENVCQAFCADILRRALRYAGQSLTCEVVGHTHDEIICQEWAEYSERARAELRALMENVPEWAAGLPLKCSIKVGERYGK